MYIKKLRLIIILCCISVCSFADPVLPGRTISDADTARVNRYIRNALWSASKPDAIQYMKANIDSAESICEEKNADLPVLLHVARAEYFFLNNDYKNALSEASSAAEKSKSDRDEPALARTMNFLGRYNLRTGQIKESIENFSSSIEIAEKSEIKGLIPAGYNGLADDYFSLGEMNEYKINLQKLIESAHEEKDTFYLQTGYWRLGTILSDREKDYHRADSLLRRCLEISLRKKDTSFISMSWANLGWTFYLQKKFNSAINCYNKSLEYSVPGKRHKTSSNSYGNLGTIYRDLGDSEKSLKYYEKAIEQGKLARDDYNLSWIYQDISELYLRKDDTSNAFKNYVLFKQFSDSLLIKTTSKGLTDAKIKYDADRENKELQLLSLRVSNQRLLIYGYTGLFVLSLAIGILAFSRAKIESQRRISEMNRKISEITQANLRQQMNPHFIFNTLNSIQYYMYQHDKLATNNYLTKFSSLMRKVLENSQHTSISLRDEIDALTLYLELEMIRFKDKFDYELRVDDEIDPFLYKVPTMLIQPYVENSISHGLMPCEGKGHVKIRISLENEFLSCMIEDNGIGRDASQQLKGKTEINHSSLGTQIVTSRLNLVNVLYGTSLKTIYTDLKNLKGEPEGTRVEIQIPIMT